MNKNWTNPSADGSCATFFGLLKNCLPAIGIDLLRLFRLQFINSVAEFRQNGPLYPAIAGRNPPEMAAAIDGIDLLTSTGRFYHRMLWVRKFLSLLSVSIAAAMLFLPFPAGLAGDRAEDIVQLEIRAAPLTGSAAKKPVELPGGSDNPERESFHRLEAGDLEP